MTTKSMGPFRRPQGPVFPRVVAVVGILTLAAGSVLVFLAPAPERTVAVEPTSSVRPDPVITHDLAPKVVIPSKPKISKTSKKNTPHSPAPSAKPKSSGLKDRPVGGGRTSSTPTTTTTPTPKTPTTTPPAVPSVHPTLTPSPTTRPTRSSTSLPTPPTSYTLRAQVISLINQQRALAGVNELVSNSGLSTQCQNWSTHMASVNVLSHSSSGYLGEIIASGATSAESALQLWLGSTPHRDIMLDPRYREIGSGYVNGYWTVQFD